jgi:hypothetical protein
MCRLNDKHSASNIYVERKSPIKQYTRSIRCLLYLDDTQFIIVSGLVRNMSELLEEVSTVANMRGARRRRSR